MVSLRPHIASLDAAIEGSVVYFLPYKGVALVDVGKVMVSVTSLRRGPPLPSKPEYKARLLRASPRRCADGLRIIEAQVTSPHTHTRGTHRSHPRGCRLPYTKHYSHDTRGSGGAAAAAAAARAGGRVRTGRSSDRLGGRCSVCHERADRRSSSAVRRREAWRRGDARRRWRAGERPARGEADR